MANNFTGSLDALFGKMEDFVSTKTVVGEAVTIGNVVLVPLIEVSVGMGAGSIEKNEKNGEGKNAGGLGARIVPSAVLCIIDGNVQLINIKNQDAVNKLIDMVPGVAAKLNFGSFFDKKSKDGNVKEEVKFEEKTIIE